MPSNLTTNTHLDHND